MRGERRKKSRKTPRILALATEWIKRPLTKNIEDWNKTFFGGAVRWRGIKISVLGTF